MVDTNGIELISLDEAAKFLGISKPTLYRLLSSSHLRGVKVGRQWRFRKADLTTYMERSAVAVVLPRTADLEPEIEFFDTELRKAGVEPSDIPVISSDHAYGSGDGDDSDTDSLGENQVKHLLQRIIHLAITMRASDIHLEPHKFEGSVTLQLRYRVDGALHVIRRIPNSIREALVMEIKTDAATQPQERGVPQDGRLWLTVDGKEFDLRVSAIPTHFGEMVVMRILDRSFVLKGLGDYMPDPSNRQELLSLLQKPNGMLICTGPTGSGKTVTIYSCIKEIAAPSVKTITIEDPVEYLLDNTEQIACSRRNGITFTSALRSAMRLDPDIIYVGDLRDADTARLAAEATLTGHLILTSMHANDTISCVQRLLSLIVEPYVVASTLIGVVAQRLARRICDNCKREASSNKFDRAMLDYVKRVAADGNYTIPNPVTYYEGAGCDQCNGRGFRGRVALYELLVIGESLRSAILRGVSPEEFEALAIQNGMRTLFADGVRNAVEGITTLDEVMRVTYKSP